jgi:hypothetical protein
MMLIILSRVNFRKMRILIKTRKLHIDSASGELNIKSFIKEFIPAGKGNKFFRPDLFNRIFFLLFRLSGSRLAVYHIARNENY